MQFWSVWVCCSAIKSNSPTKASTGSSCITPLHSLSHMQDPCLFKARYSIQLAFCQLTACSILRELQFMCWLWGRLYGRLKNRLNTFTRWGSWSKRRCSLSVMSTQSLWWFWLLCWIWCSCLAYIALLILTSRIGSFYPLSITPFWTQSWLSCLWCPQNWSVFTHQWRLFQRSSLLSFCSIASSFNTLSKTRMHHRVATGPFKNPQLYHVSTAAQKSEFSQSNDNKTVSKLSSMEMAKQVLTKSSD